MAGPIREAIKQFRENRRERVQARRGLNSLDSIGASDEMQGSAVRRQPRALRLFRSLGAGTSRQDLIGSRKQVAKPAPRMLQQNPDGPDTGRDAGKRDYSGDALGKVTKGTTTAPRPEPTQNSKPVSPAPTRTVSQQGKFDPKAVNSAVPKDARPEVIQGGSQDLPAPMTPQAPQQSAAPKQSQVLWKKMEASRELIGNPNLSDSARMAVEKQSIYDSQMELRASQKEAAEEKARQESPAYAASQIREAAESAFDTGDYASFIAALSAGMLGQGRNPVDIPATARLSLMPVANARASQFLKASANPTDGSVSLANVPEEDRNRLLGSLAFVHPVFQNDAKGAPAVINEATSMAEFERISAKLNGTLNQTGSPSTAKFLNAVALHIVRQGGGKFRAKAISPWVTGGVQ